MHVFVTGATGWVGSAVVNALLDAGHDVTGLARSREKAGQLVERGARALRATLDELDTLRRAASQADAVIHTAFDHDFSKFADNCEQDRRVIEALGDALAGTDCPLLVTSGLSGLPKGGNEAAPLNPGSPRRSEATALRLAERGVRAATIRLAPSVHGVGEHGFVSILIRLAREQGVSAYLEAGENCWSGVHRLDAAHVYRLALEQGVTERVYHAVADQSVPFRAIAEAIGRRLGVPVEPRPREHFGWFATMAGADMAADSSRTREVLGWAPREASLLDDLDQAAYYAP